MAAMDRLPEAGELLSRADAEAAAAAAASPAADPSPSGPGTNAPSTTAMQRDYLWAFLTLSGVPLHPPRHAAADEQSPQHSTDSMRAAVAAVVHKHAAQVSAGRWATLWADMASYVSELQAQQAAQAQHGAEGGADEALHEDHASAAPTARDAFLSLDATEGPKGRVVVSTPGYEGASGAGGADGGEQEWLEVAFREVDIEVAFSMRPFEELHEGGGVELVEPRWSVRVAAHASGTTQLDLSALAPGATPQRLAHPPFPEHTPFPRHQQHAWHARHATAPPSPLSTTHRSIGAQPGCTWSLEA